MRRRTAQPSPNHEAVSALQERLVLMRRYAGTREEVVKAWGLNDATQLDQIEKAQLKNLHKLAKYADHLGIELQLDIKLPKN